MRTIRFCFLCSKELNARNKKYCSNLCQREHQYVLYINRWLAGEESGGGAFEVSNYVRRWMAERYGDICWLCAWSKVNTYTGKVPLQIDHIDGDAFNNSVDNLRLLCPGCHSLTETFGNISGRTSTRTYRYGRM